MATRLSPLLRPLARAAGRPALVARARVLPTLVAPRWASSAPSMSSLAPNLPPIPAGAGIKVAAPNLQKIKEEGFLDEDAKLVPESEAQLVITPDAIRQLAILASKEPADTPLALRVGVDSGGCHGYQYIMELTEERGVDDYVFTPEGVAAIPVVVDLMSLGLLKGATLHYATELIGSSFRLQDNPQAKDGGACGCGVSWEAKEGIVN